MITKISGQLEIDHNRGVVYFHANDPKIIDTFGTATPLRICRLPIPIPPNCSLDITHMTGCNWKVAPVEWTAEEILNREG
jgi:hypothetical protein